MWGVAGRASVPDVVGEHDAGFDALGGPGRTGVHGVSSILPLSRDLNLKRYRLRAYRDADLLDRYHLPYIGAIAQRWVEEE